MIITEYHQKHSNLRLLVGMDKMDNELESKEGQNFGQYSQPFIFFVNNK